MNSNLTFISPRIVKPSAASALSFWSICKVWRLFVVCEDPNTSRENSLKPFCHRESNNPVSSTALLGNITSARINISIWALKLRKITLVLHGTAYFFSLGYCTLCRSFSPCQTDCHCIWLSLVPCVDHLSGRILWLSEFQLCVFKKVPFYYFLEKRQHFLCPWWHLLYT